MSEERESLDKLQKIITLVHNQQEFLQSSLMRNSGSLRKLEINFTKMKPCINDLNHGIVARINKEEKKREIDRNVNMISQEMPKMERCKETNVMNVGLQKTSGFSETMSSDQVREIPYPMLNVENNEKIEDPRELAESIKNLSEKANLHENILEEQNTKIQNLIDELKHLEKRQIDFLNEKHTTLMKTIGKTTIAWTKKMQKLNTKVDELAISCESKKKAENQRTSKFFRAMKENLHNMMADSNSKSKKNFAIVQNRFNLEIKELSKTQNNMIADISGTKLVLQRLHMESLSTQERMKSTKNHFLNLQKELERSQLEAEIANKKAIEVAIKGMEEQARCKEQEIERKKQQWEVEKNVWEAQIKHSGDLLESLKESIKQSFTSRLTKEKELTTLEVQRLQNHLNEREKEIAIIQEQFSSVISKISKPFNPEHAL